MADTFLNTTRTTGLATSNVQENINQANNGQQPIQNNVNGTNGINQTIQPPNNQMNPITIPIQIQPQIAPTGQPQSTSSNAQPNQNLQVGNTQPTYNAPTPQTYQANNTNSNVVDFNQIYQSYNNAMGKANQSTTASGIKKSSYNTTIVTPTTTNLNTVEGQYQSEYSDTINSVISTMLTQVEKLRVGDFGYDPTQDMALRMASEYAANSTLQSLAGSGVLNSSATAERVARIVSELIPQYEEKAYNRQIQYLSQLADTAQLVMNFDSQQFQYWKDGKDREFQEKEFEYKKQQDALENAWKRVDELGYVDNQASTILGVKVGTLSGAARQAKEQREFELQKMREQAQIEHANNVALTKLKMELQTKQEKELASYNNMLQVGRMELQNKLDTQKSKELASYNNALEKDLANYKSQLSTKQSKELASYENSLKQSNMEYEYTLANKYGSSSSSKSRSSNLSTYDEIIKNRFAEYDDFTKQYVVPDQQTYNELGNYLDKLYASGAINETEFMQLSAKYSKFNNNNTSTNNNNSNDEANRKYINDAVEAVKKSIRLFG